MKSNGNYRTNNFDFLRLFAAFTVLVQHSVEHLNISFFWFKPENEIWYFDGVPLFFILSGMLVYRSYERHVQSNRTLRNYLTNRYLRVAPAIYIYLILISISFLITGVINFKDITELGFIKWILSGFLLVPISYPLIFESFGTGVVNGSLWTIPQEFSFYLVIPFIYFLEKKVGFLKSLGIMFVLSIVGIYFLNLKEVINPNIYFLYIHTFLPYLTYFTLGIVWLRFWGRMPKNAYLAILGVILYLIIRNVNIFHSGLGVFWTVCWSIPLSYSIVWFGYKGPDIFNKITNKIGDLSFGIYIWHMVFVNYFMYFGIVDKLKDLPGTVIHLLVILLTFILAALSWNFIEKPALKFKPYSSRNIETNIKKISA